MSFALLIIGITLVVAAVRGTHLQLLVLLKGDFTGEGNFWYWIAALLIVGSVGYVPRLKGISDGLLVIILLALVLAKGNPAKNINGGFFEQFTAALGTTKSAGGSSTATVSAGGVDLTIKPGRITNPSEWITLPNGDVWTPTGW